MAAVESTSLLARLKTAKRLPSPPGTALRVLELSRREDTDVHQIADVIMSDPALSTRLLKYANSPSLGVGREVTSVRDAVLLMGLRTVRLTALGFSLAAPDFQPQCLDFDLHRFWADSFATAVIARRLAVEVFNTDREEAFTAGLLAGIGRLALAHGLPEEYGRVLREARAGRPLIETERDLLGTDHVQFGAQLLADWGLPDLLVQAVRRETTPCEPPRAGARGHLLGRLVHLAAQLAPVFTDELSPKQRVAVRRVVENELRLDEQSWQRIADDIMADYRQVAELFDVELDDQASVFDLYAEAQEEVTNVGMVAQLERTQALEENKTLLHRATTDALTGVANRAKLDERLGELLRGLARGHAHFALLMLDIDHFKKFNDTYGHDVGDLVLKHVAQTVFHTLRDVDLLARYGGEEFVILAPCTDRRGACIVAIRVCKRVQRLRVPVNGRELNVTLSVGLALSSDHDSPPSAEKLLADADKQLYLSKHAGRNTWSYLDRTASKLTAAQAMPSSALP